MANYFIQWSENGLTQHLYNESKCLHIIKITQGYATLQTPQEVERLLLRSHLMLRPITHTHMCVNIHTCSHTMSLAHLAGISAPVGAPSTEHVLSDGISIV